MITFKINGESKEVPTCWEDLTFEQYLKFFELKDDVLQLVAIVTGLDYEYIKKATIVGVDRLFEALSFINVHPEIPGYTAILGPYTIPPNKDGVFDIRFESVAQFEDMRHVIRKLPENDIKAHTAAYADYVAIYMQKIKDGEYDANKVSEVKAEVMTFPAIQVISLGSFFFLKLLSSFNGTRKTSPNTSQPQKKTKQDLNGSAKRSARLRPLRKRR